jgi:uncharacterized membrane protein
LAARNAQENALKRNLVIVTSASCITLGNVILPFIAIGATVITHGWAQHQLPMSAKFAFVSGVLAGFMMGFVMLGSDLSATQTVFIIHGSLHS